MPHGALVLFYALAVSVLVGRLSMQQRTVIIVKRYKCLSVTVVTSLERTPLAERHSCTLQWLDNLEQ